MKKEQVLPNPDFLREQCVEQCKGCDKMFSDENIGNVCIAYKSPAIKHKLGCALKSNKDVEVEDTKKINPLKASRRKYKG